MNITPIEEFKNKLATEFVFTESYSTELDLERSFNHGVILLTPHPKDRQRPWLAKSVFEWNRTGRTIVLITPFKPACRYFSKFVTQNAEIRPITDSLIYTSNQREIKPMCVAIFKEKTAKPLSTYVTFD